jgi:hypothetical protein
VIHKRISQNMANEFNWDWNDFCSTGLNISTDTNKISPCVQQIFIHFPTFSLIAIASSYEYGKLHLKVLRNRTQSTCIILRALVCLVLAFSPLFNLLYDLRNVIKIWPSDVLISCTETIAWVLHSGMKY